MRRCAVGMNNPASDAELGMFEIDFGSICFWCRKKCIGVSRFHYFTIFHKYYLLCQTFCLRPVMAGHDDRRAGFMRVCDLRLDKAN